MGDQAAVGVKVAGKTAHLAGHEGVQIKAKARVAAGERAMQEKGIPYATGADISTGRAGIATGIR